MSKMIEFYNVAEGRSVYGTEEDDGQISVGITRDRSWAARRFPNPEWEWRYFDPEAILGGNNGQ